MRERLSIKFYWSGSIVGHLHYMKVGGIDVDLELGVISNEVEAKLKIVEILKRDFNIIFDEDDIEF